MPLTLVGHADATPAATSAARDLPQWAAAHGLEPASIPDRWQPRNDWHPGSGDAASHAESALEHMERSMRNLKALLGDAAAPAASGPRVA